jgi:hypothetical protein
MPPKIPEPEVRITRYEVSCLQPGDHTNADLFTLTVEWRGNDSWGVLRGSVAYAYDGTCATRTPDQPNATPTGDPT